MPLLDDELGGSSRGDVSQRAVFLCVKPRSCERRAVGILAWKLMRSLYNALFTLLFWLSSPYYFLKMWRRGNWRENFGQRFGRYSSRLKHALTNRRVLWMHAVSVGEVNVCTQLIRALEPRVPNVKIVVSTTTTTGMAELHRKLPTHIEKIYFPIDCRKYVNRALNVIHPEAVVLVEAEIWPNFLWRLKERHIPVFLVNARLSQRSFRGYRRAQFLFRPLFASLKGVGAQDEADAARLRELGCRPERVRVVGSLKYDAAILERPKFVDVPRLLRQVGVPEGARVLLGGSTHPGEERILAQVFQRLRARFPDLFLILVPRHHERGKQVGRELAALGLRFVFRSEITAETRLSTGSVDCLVVNTTGELRCFYEHADLIFVGKSLAARGGQNPIEPASFGKPILFGPNMQNFLAASTAFVAQRGAIQVKDAADLEGALAALLMDESARKSLGDNAVKVIRDNLGAIERTADMIVSSLNQES